MISIRSCLPSWAAVLAGLVLAASCANPAENVTEAKVSDPPSATTVAEPAAPAAPTQPVAAKVFVFDETNSAIEWTGSKVTGKHDGGFAQFKGQLRVVEGNPGASSVRVEIDMNSVTSDNARLTNHLKSADFFEVQTWPTASFESTAIAPIEGDRYEVTGNLTLHGVTKQITFPATIRVEPDAVAVDAEFFIRRFDFEIKYPGAADDLIRDEVVIRLRVRATPAA